MKKVIFIVVVLVLIAVGGYLYWKSTTEKEGENESKPIESAPSRANSVQSTLPSKTVQVSSAVMDRINKRIPKA